MQVAAARCQNNAGCRYYWPVATHSTASGRGGTYLSAPLPAVRRVLPDLVSGQGGAPAQLRPVWQSVGAPRPWREGAAGPPGLARAAGAAGEQRRGEREVAQRRPGTGNVRRREQRTHRGVRAGRRLQCRRHGMARDANLAPPTKIRPPWRCLTVSDRLTRRQTDRRRTDRTAPPRRGSPTRKRLKIAHLNVRSLAAAHKIDEVRLLLQDHAIDILCLTESWLTRDISSNILIFPGYRVYRRDRTAPCRGRNRVRGGGIVVLVRDGVEVAELNIKSPPDSRVESLWLNITSCGRSASVGTMYRAPDGTISTDIDTIRRQLEELIVRAKPLFLLGDLNIDIASDKSTGVIRYKAMLSDLNLHQLIHQPTRLGDPGTIIDHIITNLPDIQQHAAVVAAHISDHEMVTLEALQRNSRLAPRTATVRSLQPSAVGSSHGRLGVCVQCSMCGLQIRRVSNCLEQHR